MESRKHQRDPEGSGNLPSVEARRPSGAAERDYSFRIRPGLRAQNFTLHGRLQVQPQPSAASIFSFPPWVLAISCEVGIKVANNTKWGRERAAKNSSSAEVLLLILQDGQGLLTSSEVLSGLLGLPGRLSTGREERPGFHRPDPQGCLFPKALWLLSRSRVVWKEEKRGAVCFNSTLLEATWERMGWNGFKKKSK